MVRFVLRARRNVLSAVVVIYLAASAAFSQEPTPWSQNASPLPPRTGTVNDYAGVIDGATKQQIETRLRDFQKKSNVQLAVAVVGTTGDRDIFDYSLAVARGWKIGSKDDDNPGALLFVAIDDRKYFTQISRDLEDELPDALAKNLQRQYLVPEFKKGNYGKGIADTLDAYIRTIEARSSGTATPTPAATDESGGASSTLYSGFCCLVIILVIVLIIASNRGGRSGRGRGGWGRGGFGGGAGALPWIIGSAIANAADSSSSSDWGSSGGSSDWGGGGGSDWGGFGGGDFGGGGAGGDW